MSARTAVVCFAVLLAAGVWACAATITVISGDTRIEVDAETLDSIEGVVAYQGGGEDNWTDPVSYTGVEVEALLNAVGGISEDDTVSFVSSDGFYRTVPATSVTDPFGGSVILALSAEGEGEDWDEAPLLVFLPPDEVFSTEDLTALLGPTYSEGLRSAKSLLVQNVAYVVVNYGGQALSADDGDSSTVLSVVVAGEETDYTLDALERIGLITAQASGANSAFFYTGVPLASLIGETESDEVVRFVYEDGRTDVMSAGQIRADVPSILVAILKDGSYLDSEHGVLLVDTGVQGSIAEIPDEPVVVIDVPGIYEKSTLELRGSMQYSFSREVLESSARWSGAPATVCSSRSGLVTTYVGLPLWRAIAYVDDTTAPVGEGIVFDDDAFGSNAEGVTVTVIAEDGFTQSFPLGLVARDDRFILATLKNGLFLDFEDSGTVVFAFDDSVELPEGMKLWSVKSVVRIELTWAETP